MRAKRWNDRNSEYAQEMREWHEEIDRKFYSQGVTQWDLACLGAGGEENLQRELRNEERERRIDELKKLMRKFQGERVNTPRWYEWDGKLKKYVHRDKFDPVEGAAKVAEFIDGLKKISNYYTSNDEDEWIREQAEITIRRKSIFERTQLSDVLKNFWRHNLKSRGYYDGILDKLQRRIDDIRAQMEEEPKKAGIIIVKVVELEKRAEMEV